MYTADLPEPERPEAASALLQVDEIRDQAWAFVDGVPAGSVSRMLQQRTIAVPAGRRLELIVEEQGRVNYDVRIGEAKGLIGAVRVGSRDVHGWTATPVDLDALATRIADDTASVPVRGPLAGPVGLRAAFDLAEPSDLFLDTAGLGKGYAVVNGFLLGRYWAAGPQRTLYVPAPVTRSGQNVVVVVEIEQVTATDLRFVSHPLLGHLEE